MTSVVSQKVFQIEVTLVGGIYSSGTSVPGLGSTSRLLSITRAIAGGGAVGTPSAYLVPVFADPAVFGGYVQLVVQSSVDTDVGTYIVSWSNDYISSQLYPQTGDVVGQQYSP